MPIIQRSSLSGFGQKANERYIVEDIQELVASVNSGSLPSFLEYNAAQSTIWNNGKNNISTNTSFGEEALKSNTTGTTNTAFGYKALSSNTTLYDNTAFGSSAGQLAASSGNTFIGSNAGASITSGYSSTFVGAYAGFQATSGVQNTSLGEGSSSTVTTGQSNVALGYGALQNATTGSRNIAIGRNTSTATSNTSDTVLVGDYASGGTSSIVIGANSTDDFFGGCLVIGRNAIATAAGQVVIGSTSYPVGTVTTETVTSTKTWRVKINGVDYKILLA